MFGPELISQLTALVSVVLIDIVLAGDNAVVVGTAAAGLPPAQQRRVIMHRRRRWRWSRASLFALVAMQLLAIIGLLLAGGLLLLWVAWKIWRELHTGGHAARRAPRPRRPAPKTMRSAIMQVAVADISMSLDNVLAVAGAARDHPYIMIFGLVLSIALMAVAAQLIARLIDRHRWIAYVGLVIVLLVAVRMIWEGGLEVLPRTSTASPERRRSTGRAIRPRRGSPAAWTSSPTNGREPREVVARTAPARSARRRVVGRLVRPGRARVRAGRRRRSAQACGTRRPNTGWTVIGACSRPPVQRRVQQGAGGA